jgi:hypothetical protein
MTGSRAVVISVPARNEASTITACLAGLDATVDNARRAGLVDRAVVVIAAHRCGDTTGAVAAGWLRHADLPGHVVVDDESLTVGMVRDRAARYGLALLGGELAAGDSWVLSTDADTVVGDDWIASILDVAHSRGAACVVGLAALDEWRGSAESLAAYNNLLLAKYRDTAVGPEHDHVYGANLAVRVDAYLAVGGFPHTPHGEDQQLVDALVSAGYPIARTRAVSVTTSGRTVGRADDGLADLLWRLDDPLRTPDAHNSRPSTTDDPGPDTYGLEDAANVRR